MILIERDVFVNLHDVDDISLPTTSFALSTDSNYPVTALCQLNDISPIDSSCFLYLQYTSVQTLFGVWSQAGVVVNDVAKESHGIRPLVMLCALLVTVGTACFGRPILRNVVALACGFRLDPPRGRTLDRDFSAERAEDALHFGESILSGLPARSLPSVLIRTALSNRRLLVVPFTKTSRSLCRLKTRRWRTWKFFENRQSNSRLAELGRPACSLDLKEPHQV